MFDACGVSMLGAAGAALADTAETAKPRAPIKARAAMRIVSTSCATSRRKNDGCARQFRFSAPASPKGQDTPPFIYPPRAAAGLSRVLVAGRRSESPGSSTVGSSDQIPKRRLRKGSCAPNGVKFPTSYYRQNISPVLPEFDISGHLLSHILTEWFGGGASMPG